MKVYHSVAGWTALCVSLFSLSSSAQESQPESAPAASQPTSQPTSMEQSASEPQKEDLSALAAEFAAELSSPEAPPSAAPSLPAQGSGARRFRFLPDLSFVGSVFGAVFPNGPSDPDLREHDPAESGFGLQEIELAAQAIVDPFFRADIFLGFGLDEIELEEAFLTTLSRLPLGMQLRAGHFLTRFGRQNSQHLHIWEFTDLPLPNRRFFGGEGLRDLGVEASFRLPALGQRGAFGPPLVTPELTFSVQQGTNEISFGEKDFGGPFSEGGGFLKFLYTAQLTTFFDLSDQTGLLIGASGAISSNDTTDAQAEGLPNRTGIYGAHLFFRHRPNRSFGFLNVTAEYMLREAQIPGAVVREGGAYLQIAGRFNRNWEAALRLDAIGLPALVVGNAAALEDEVASRFTPRDEYRISSAVSYYTSEFFRLRLQAGLDRSDTDGDGVLDGFFPEVILQANFSIGAHGAHPY